MFNFDAYFAGIFGIWGQKPGGGGGLTPKGKVAKPTHFEFLDKPFNLAKFHPNWRDSMCHPCLVLWWTQS